MLKTACSPSLKVEPAYHLGEGRVLKTVYSFAKPAASAYHLGEGRVLKTEKTMKDVLS